MRFKSGALEFGFNGSSLDAFNPVICWPGCSLGQSMSSTGPCFNASSPVLQCDPVERGSVPEIRDVLPTGMWFLWCVDGLELDTAVAVVSGDEELQRMQLYFVLPVVMQQRPL
jgi:hypothetical protein